MNLSRQRHGTGEPSQRTLCSCAPCPDPFQRGCSIIPGQDSPSFHDLRRGRSPRRRWVSLLELPLPRFPRSLCLASPSCTDAKCRQARSRCLPVNGRHVQSVMDNSVMSTTKSKRLAGCNWFFCSVKSFYVFSINIFALIGRRR